MVGLRELVKEELEKYTGLGANCYVFPVFDDDRQHYAALVIDYPVRKEQGDLVIFTRIVGDKIIIEEDSTDKPLVDALVQRGIPREQIILAYQGEAVPQEALLSK